MKKCRRKRIRIKKAESKSDSSTIENGIEKMKDRNHWTSRKEWEFFKSEEEYEKGFVERRMRQKGKKSDLEWVSWFIVSKTTVDSEISSKWSFPSQIKASLFHYKRGIDGLNTIRKSILNEFSSKGSFFEKNSDLCDFFHHHWFVFLLFSSLVNHNTTTTLLFPQSHFLLHFFPFTFSNVVQHMKENKQTNQTKKTQKDR